jgi:hypothetical protein
MQLMLCRVGVYGALAVSLSIASVANADPFLWGSSSEGTNPASIFTIDVTTGAATLVGPVGLLDSIGRVNKVSAVAVDPTDGTLYGMFGSACTGARLITIDPITGAGTSIGYLVGSGFDGSDDTGSGSTGGFAGGCPAGSDALAFTKDGTLYAGGWNGGAVGGKLLVVDKTTAVVTANLTTDLDSFGRPSHLAGLAVHPVTGEIWVSRGNNAPGRIHTIDPTTGAFIATVFLSEPLARLSDITFTTDGVLFASIPNTGRLVTVDTLNGMVTDVGPFGDGERISGLNGVGYFPDQTRIRNVPTPRGNNVPVIELNVLEQVTSRVVVAGTTNADVCAAPDPREVVRRNGQTQFKQQYLDVSALSGKGTCVDEFAELLNQIDLRVSPWYRGYPGWLDLDDDDIRDNGEVAVWLVVAVIRTTSQADGPVVVLPAPEALVDYAGQPYDPSFKTASAPGQTACSFPLAWRPMSLGGAVPAFGDFPNAEGNRMLMETAQCDGPASMTRRTTHVYPLRLDAKSNEEHINLQWQLNGIGDTVLQAYDACLIPPVELSTIQSLLDAARPARAQARWDDLIALLEEIARTAKATNFDDCPAGSNFKGNFMSRALSAAFTVWDRFLHPIPGTWAEYLIPADLEVPVLNSAP